METINLTPEVVNAYKEILVNPEKYKCAFKPFKDCFIKSETITANHILFQDYLNYIKKPLPKIIFYIIMVEEYGQLEGKDSNGCLGYFLKAL